MEHDFGFEPNLPAPQTSVLTANTNHAYIQLFMRIQRLLKLHGFLPSCIIPATDLRASNSTLYLSAPTLWNHTSITDLSIGVD